MKKWVIVGTAIGLGFLMLVLVRSLTHVEKVTQADLVGSYQSINTFPYRQMQLMSNGIYSCDFCYSGKWANVTGAWIVSTGRSPYPVVMLYDIRSSEDGLPETLVLPVLRTPHGIDVELNEGQRFHK